MSSSSIATMCFLAKFCLAPVKKACGKKNPESQKAGGRPSLIHFEMKEILWFRSRIQEDNGLSERKPTPEKMSGT